MDPIADPEQVARHDQSVAVSGGRGVFPKLPPGVLTLPMVGVLARFEGRAGAADPRPGRVPRRAGQSAATPSGSCSTRRCARSRADRGRSPSACDPTEWQCGRLATDLPAGRYLVGVSVSDGAGRRGVFRAETEIERAKPERLALSDVVVTCGMPRVEQPLRLEPNPAALVAGSGAHRVLRDLPSRRRPRWGIALRDDLHRPLDGEGRAHLVPARPRAAAGAAADQRDSRGNPDRAAAASVRERAGRCAAAGALPARDPGARPQSRRGGGRADRSS